MYVVKLGMSHMADFYGLFETREEAQTWIEEHGLNPEVCSVQQVLNKAEYALPF